MAKLIFVDRDFVGQVYKLVVEKTTVGRGDQNTLVLRHDTVSSRHCEILANDPEVIVRDLGSRNGTFVDGVRFSGQRQVKSGQIIRFGQVEARLELDHKLPDDSSTEETAVHLHKRAIREGAAGPKPTPKSQAQPAPLPAAAGRSAPEEPTILSPQTTNRMPAPVPLLETTPELAKSSGKGTVAAAAVGIAFAIVMLLWWLLTRN